jgi:hypothetical protein
VTLYLVGGVVVLVGSGIMAMAGLGAAFIFVPLFYFLGVPLGEATSTALLLNAVSLGAAAISYARAGLVQWRTGVPVLVAAVALAPVGALMSAHVERRVLLALFAGFLVFAGAMMLLYRPRAAPAERSAPTEAALGAGLGGAAGFLGGLLGVGGGNVILPGLNWMGLAPKVAVGTTSLAVVFSSLSGFFGHVALGGLDPWFVATMAVLAATGSFAGSRITQSRISADHLKRGIGVLLWVLAAVIVWDLAG